MITTISGDNQYKVLLEINRIAGEFGQKFGKINVERIDCEEKSIEYIIDSISNSSLFSFNKLIILRNIDKNKELIDKSDLLFEIPESTQIVVVGSGLDKRSKLYKRLKKETDYREFLASDNRSLATWIIDEVKTQNATISTSDANYLIERVGTNQSLLNNELKKLITYDHKITRTNIELLCEPTPQSSVFQLLDAAFSGKGKRAMKIYDEQRAQKVEPLSIVGMITWQLHIFAIIKTSKNKSPDEIAKIAKLNPFVLRKSTGTIRSINLTQLKRLIINTLKLDIDLKTEPINADDALKHLLLQMSEAAS